MSASGTSRLVAGGLVAVVAGLGVAAACGGGAAREQVTTGGVDRPQSRIAAPEGRYFASPVWWPRQKRIVVTVSALDAFTSRLYAVRLDGSQLEPLPLRAQPGCAYTSHAHPRLLGDGSIGFVQQCWGDGVDPRTAVTLRAYDGARMRKLVSYPLRFQMGPFALAPDMAMGVINNQDGLYEQLLRLDPTRTQPLELGLERVGFPSWSPVADELVVDAVRAGAGMEGTARTDLPRGLYVLTPPRFERRELIPDLRRAGASSWSTDGRHVALYMSGLHVPAGVYVVNVASGRRSSIVRGESYEMATWLPGQRLAVAAGGPLFEQQPLSRIEIFALPPTLP